MSCFPFPWAVVRWLPGEDALTGRIDSMPDAARTLGRFVAELQDLDITISPEPRTTGPHRGAPLVGHDDAFRTALAQCEGLLDVNRVREVWDDALAAPVWDGAPTWLHADLIPGNLLVRDGQLVGVIDFGCLTTGDPAYDVTPAWHLLDRQSRQVFREVVGPDDGTWRRARGWSCATPSRPSPTTCTPTRRWWRRPAAESAKRSRIPPDPGHLLPSARSLDEYRTAPPGTG